MKPATQFVISQSGWLAYLFAVFALANSAYVCEGLWQGVGLYGFVFQPGRGGRQPHFVSVWAAFVQMLVFAGLAGVLFGISLWRKRTKLSCRERQSAAYPHRRRPRKAYRLPESWRRG